MTARSCGSMTRAASARSTTWCAVRRRRTRCWPGWGRSRSGPASTAPISTARAPARAIRPLDVLLRQAAALDRVAPRPADHAFFDGDEVAVEAAVAAGFFFVDFGFFASRLLRF